MTHPSRTAPPLSALGRQAAAAPATKPKRKRAAKQRADDTAMLQAWLDAPGRTKVLPPKKTPAKKAVRKAK